MTLPTLNTKKVDPDNQGAYDNFGTYFSPSNAALTHFGSNPEEIQFAAFNAPVLTDQKIADITSATLHFTVATSDVAQISTVRLWEYGYNSVAETALLADQTNTTIYQSTGSNDQTYNGYNLVSGALQGYFDTTHGHYLGNVSTPLNSYSVNVTSDILDAISRGSYAFFAFSVTDGGATTISNVSLTVDGYALGINGTRADQHILSSYVTAPFRNVSFGDPQPNTDDTVNITILDGSGNGTDKLGTLTGGGFLTSYGYGNYTLQAGSATALGNEIRSLNYHPASAPNGSAYTAHFEIDFQTTSEGAISDTKTSVVVSGDACYREGTRIRTERGDVPVEQLRIGDHVLTVSGGSRPVRWLGHRRLDCSRHPFPEQVWPIRISADAFAPGMPSRSLWVSPAHCIAFAGVLIPARRLCNGRSVVQVPTGRITYWHIELDTHDVLLAQDLPAESYLEDGNRGSFDNGDGVVDLHPDLAHATAAGACLPVMERGDPVQAAKRSLLVRAAGQGHKDTDEQGLLLRTREGCIPPCWRDRGRVMLALPRAGEAVLESRTWVPEHMTPASDDARRLGVCVLALWVDGVRVPLDSPLLRQGWLDVEPAGAGLQRWTDGRGTLPHGRLFRLELAEGARYWDDEPREGLAEAARG